MTNASPLLASKTALRRRWTELQELIWRWDPIGVSQDPGWPRDEYDCLVGPLLRRLEKGESTQEISRHLEHVIADHFGLDPRHHDLPSVAEEAKQWFELSQRARPAS